LLTAERDCQIYMTLSLLLSIINIFMEMLNKSFINSNIELTTLKCPATTFLDLDICEEDEGEFGERI